MTEVRCVCVASIIWVRGCVVMYSWIFNAKEKQRFKTYLGTLTPFVNISTKRSILSHWLKRETLMWTVEYKDADCDRCGQKHSDCVSSQCASVCLPFSCQNLWVSNTSLKTSSQRLNITNNNNIFHRYVTHQWWCNVTLQFSSCTAKYQKRCFMINHKVRASHQSWPTFSAYTGHKWVVEEAVMPNSTLIISKHHQQTVL